MKLKKAILQVLDRDQLKAVCDELGINDVDRRSVDAMRAKLSRARRATPEVLFSDIGEEAVKAVAELVGEDSTGRRTVLIAKLLVAGAGVRKTSGETESGDGATVSSDRQARKRGDAGATETAFQYTHREQAVQRPDVGVQDQFQTRRPPRTYRYDSSLDPALSWDEQRERDLGEWLLGLIEGAARDGEDVVFAKPKIWKGGGVRVASVQEAIDLLKAASKPYLNWAGKAERHEIEIPTLPLFVHERHSTKAILDGIRHRKAKGLSLDLFGDPQMDIRDRLEAYEHQGPWQNRMILGDSLAVMNSLLEFEGLGGQVQMIYIDPPYGVKFGSNFQPFVRSRTVSDAGDDSMTREPEMVKAYRDTWELGLHSYLSYIRDRFMVSRELLSQSGSIFVQISEDNVHFVRAVLDEIFGASNFVVCITVKKTGSQRGSLIQSVTDFLLWYAKDKPSCVGYASKLFVGLSLEEQIEGGFNLVELEDGTDIPLRTLLKDDEGLGEGALRVTSENIGARLFASNPLTSGGFRKNQSLKFSYQNKEYDPGIERGSCWKHTVRNDDGSIPGMQRLANAGRLFVGKKQLRFKRYVSDFPFKELTSLWDGLGGASNPIYVVQTNPEVIARCMLMTTQPGDIVLDPTCGSGTTAYVAEKWGRRWITIDTSRVPLALARQRMLTATYSYYDLKSPLHGPSGGFRYEAKTDANGRPVGGIVPHITSSTIANDEPAALETLVDKPEEIRAVTRVSGPFVVEAIIAPVQPLSESNEIVDQISDPAGHVDRMTEVLRQSKTLQLQGNRELSLLGIRRTAGTEFLHAEATEGNNHIAIVFGPEDGAISSMTVYEAAREAHFLKYDRLFLFGFAIQAKAREMIEDAKQLRIPATYVAVSPDVAMADLLKTTRASEIFSITGLPDFDVRRAKKKGTDGAELYEVELVGLDIFNPETLEQESTDGQSVPCWMLDTDYDGFCFYATQVFFPKTSAWDNVQKSLDVFFDESVWTHLAGTVSEPFSPGERRRVAVKVIDERGNELLRVRDIEG